MFRPKQFLACVLVAATACVFTAPSASATGGPDTSPFVPNTNLQITSQVLSESEVRFTVVADGRKVEAVVTKDRENVTTKYFHDDKLVLTDVRKLADAVRRGQVAKQVSPRSIRAVVPDPEMGGTMPVGDYVFDGVVYSPKSPSQPYEHPDKNYYRISPYSTSSKKGLQNVYVQVNQYDSNAILQTPAWAVGSGIGAAAGGLVSKSIAGAVVGAIIGGALGAYFGAQLNRIADENGCIWFVIDNNPPLVNLGAWWSPAWYMDVRYVAVGPYSKTHFYYYMQEPGR